MPRPLTLKDNLQESHLFMRRVIAAVIGSALLVSALIGRLIYLQVVAYETYKTQSEDNRVKIEAVPPNRGLIYDRNGVLLAENLPAYRLDIIPEQVQDLDYTLKQLARLIELRDYDLERFEKQRERLRTRPFEGIPLRLHLSDEEVARFAINRHRLPGVEVRAVLTRHYPFGSSTAHAIGYVGRVNEKDLQILDETNYRGTTHTGKVGVEKAYEDILHGAVGYQNLETNVQGRTLRVLDRQSPVPGSDLYLNLDIRLQQATEAAFEDYSGAAVAIDPRNGAVLAFASLPGFDPNPFVKGIDVDDYNALQHNIDQPLFNRALRGQYPPGSTLKPFVGLAGLEAGATHAHSKTFCPGFYQLPEGERKYRDWKRSGHGMVDLNDAIAQSCDVYFYDLARTLGIDKMHDFLAQFGFGHKSGIDLVGELGGLLPSRDWKRNSRNEPWFPGETLISGIGQGFNLTTPIQLAAGTAALATYGQYHTPHMVNALRRPGSDALEPVHVQPVKRIPIINHDHWQQVIDSMIAVVHGPRGTARKLAEGIDYRIAGKTGTAQVFSLPQEDEYEYDPEEIEKRLRDHALFVAFAPADQPEIALGVIVENGGSGSGVAGPIARKILDAYFAGKHATQ